MANPLVKTRCESSDNMERVEQRVVEFLCAGAGGPESYSGRDMLATLRGMNISEQEFVPVGDDAVAELESSGIDSGTRSEVLAIHCR